MVWLFFCFSYRKFIFFRGFSFVYFVRLISFILRLIRLVWFGGVFVCNGEFGEFFEFLEG